MEVEDLQETPLKRDPGSRTLKIGAESGIPGQPQNHLSPALREEPMPFLISWSIHAKAARQTSWRERGEAWVRRAEKRGGDEMMGRIESLQLLLPASTPLSLGGSLPTRPPTCSPALPCPGPRPALPPPP